ncbi:MAG: FAD-dependent oxidoreductase [Planctomycetota bacterium]
MHGSGAMGDASDALVLGAGVIGLTTAVEALERGARVEVWTRAASAATTSAVAAALWYPFLAEPRERVLAWSRTTFEVLARLARDEPAAGVRMVRFLEVFQEPEPDLWWRDVVPSLRWLPQGEVPAPFRAAVEVEVPVADTRVYLPWLLARCAALGGVVVQREATSLAAAAGDGSRVTFQCTGLGARELCGDTSLVPIRGQVLVARGVAVPRGLIDDSGPRPIYAIPRGDELVLGGTAQRADERLEVDLDDSAQILAGVKQLLPHLDARDIFVQKVGLRPWRPTVRLERERLANGALVVHNYGHGGSGYTVAWGCAREAVDLALGL